MNRPVADLMVARPLAGRPATPSKATDLNGSEFMALSLEWLPSQPVLPERGRSLGRSIGAV